MLQRLRALRDPRGVSLLGDSAALEASGRVPIHRTPVSGNERAENAGMIHANRWPRVPVWGTLPMFVGLLLAVVFGSLRLVNWLATPSNAIAESAQIGGISLAMSRSQVCDRLGRPEHERDWLPTESGLPEPWNRNLQASDFFVRMPNRVIRMASWHRDCLQVLFDGERVIGVRVESPEVATGPRGVMIGDDERTIDRRYPAVRPTMIDLPNGQFSMLLRYPDQGVAFEIHNRTVQAIALFPPLGSDRPPGE
jgi:hypothetical protein